MLHLSPVVPNSGPEPPPELEAQLRRCCAAYLEPGLNDSFMATARQLASSPITLLRQELLAELLPVARSIRTSVEANLNALSSSRASMWARDLAQPHTWLMSGSQEPTRMLEEHLRLVQANVAANGSALRTIGERGGGRTHLDRLYVTVLTEQTATLANFTSQAQSALALMRQDCVGRYLHTCELVCDLLATVMRRIEQLVEQRIACLEERAGMQLLQLAPPEEPGARGDEAIAKQLADEAYLAYGNQLRAGMDSDINQAAGAARAARGAEAAAAAACGEVGVGPRSALQTAHTLVHLVQPRGSS